MFPYVCPSHRNILFQVCRSVRCADAMTVAEMHNSWVLRLFKQTFHLRAIRLPPQEGVCSISWNFKMTSTFQVVVNSFTQENVSLNVIRANVEDPVISPPRLQSFNHRMSTAEVNYRRITVLLCSIRRSKVQLKDKWIYIIIYSIHIFSRTTPYSPETWLINFMGRGILEKLIVTQLVNKLLKVYHCVQKSPPVFPILCWMNSVYIHTPYFFKIQFHIILSSTPWYPK
jgi:hypothetical protein